jgi:UDP-N-acetylmuramate dehydrogenase
MPFDSDLAHLIRHDEPLAPHTWLGIGGPARYFAEPVDREELCRLIRAADQAEVPVRLLGDGSNVLVRESGFDGLVIHTQAASLAELRIEQQRLIAGSGAKLSHAITRAVGAGLAGLERLAGVPGTVGGAVIGNVSSGGADIGSSVAAVRCVEPDGSCRLLERNEIDFGFRKSDLTGKVLLEVQFELEPTDPAELTKRLQKNWIIRRASRPVEPQRMVLPFVDPHGADAANLIEQVGLKGTRRGQVSLDSQFPAYMVAHPGATSDDCLELIASVREQVSKQLAIDLQLNLVIW